MKPRCGREMHPYEAVWGALLDPVVCGRPEGHPERCRSTQAIARERERYRKMWPVYRQYRKQRRDQERERELQRQEQELLRDQLTVAVRAAAKQARDRELATRKVNW